MDPYAELDLPRGEPLPPEKVKRAFKHRVKTTHPDTGGTAEAFDRTKRALAVLSDPRRKEKYDTTGKIDEDPIDNDRATALQMIEAFFQAAINEHLHGRNMKHRDIIADCRANLIAENKTSAAGRAEGQTFVKSMRELLGRFSEGSVPFRRSLEARIAMAEEQVAKLEEGERCRKLAIEIIDGCEFEFDPIGAAYQPTWFAGG